MGDVSIEFPKGRAMTFGRVHTIGIESYSYTPHSSEHGDGNVRLSIRHRHMLPPKPDIVETWVGRVSFDLDGYGHVEQFYRQVDCSVAPDIYSRQLYRLYGIANHLPDSDDPWIVVRSS